MHCKCGLSTAKTIKLSKEWLMVPAVYSALCLLMLAVSKPLFHFSAEIGSIVIGVSALLTASLSHRLTKNNFVVGCSLGLGWCALIDLGHAIAYQGMNFLPSQDPNVATQLWIGARFLQAITILAALTFSHLYSRILLFHSLLFLYSVVLFLAIGFGYFPTAFYPESGLTPFKINAEYSVIAILVCCFLLIVRKRKSHQFDAESFFGMLAAIMLMIVSELFFTLYTGVFDRFNITGHLVKIFAYWFVFRALILTTIETPFQQRDTLLAEQKKRATELAALQQLTRICANASLNKDSLLQSVIEILPSGFRFPDKTCVFIELPEKTIGNKEALSFSNKIQYTIRLPENSKGCLTVAYNSHQATATDFLKEEVTLLKMSGLQLEEALLRLDGERKLSRLNYAYEMLSRTNRAIVRCTRQDSIINETFEGLAAGGIFTCVFVALYDDSLNNLNITHKKGLSDELAESLDSELEACISATFTSTDPNKDELVSIIDSPPVHPSNNPKFMETFNFTQFALIRITDRKSNLGVVGLLTDDPDTPGGDIERLLQEMAEDLRYALWSLSESAMKSRAESLANMSEARFKALFEHSPSPMILLDKEGKKEILRNEAYSKWLNLPNKETLTTDYFFDHILGDNPARDTLKAAWKAAVEESKCSANRVFGFPEVELTALKEPKPLVGTASMIRVADNLLVAWTDLTTIRSQERRLRESENRFRTMIEQTRVPIWVRNEDGVFLYVNKAVTSATGYTKEELIGKPAVLFLDMSESEKQQLMSQWKPDAIQQKVQYLARIRHKNGSTRDLRIQASNIEWNEGRAYISIAEDITVQRKLELENEHRNRLLRELSRQVPGVIYQYQLFPDGRSCFPFASARIEEIYEVTPEEVREDATLVFDRIHPDDIERVKESIYESANQLSLWRCDYRVLLPRQGMRWLSGFARPEKLDDQSILWHGFIEDSTERKQIEYELAEHTHRLELSMKGTLEVISRMIDVRDPYTAGHERRVAAIAKVIGQAMGMSNADADVLELAGMVHDIGKIAIPSDILTKPTRLTDIEMDLVKTHAQAGYDIVQGIPLPPVIATSILQHHERINGSGYPNGLKGDNIILEAKILGVADVLESMASHRPYRPALGTKAALEELKVNSGILYDEEIVKTVDGLIASKQLVLETI